MSSKPNTSNRGILKRIKRLDFRKFIVYIKNLNSSAKLAIASIVLLLVIIPVNLILSDGAGMKHTNVYHSPEQVAQLSASAASGDETNEPSTSESPATTPIAKSQDLNGAIQHAAIKDAFGAKEKSTTPQPAQSPEATTSQSQAENGSTLYETLNSLTDMLTYVPDSLSLQEQSQVASVKAEQESTPPTEGAGLTTTDKINDIQAQLNSINKLVTGVETTGETDANNSSGQADTAVESASAGVDPLVTQQPDASPTEQPGTQESAPVVTQIPRSNSPEATQDDEDQDVDDDTALVTLDIVAIPPAEVSGSISEEEASIEAFIEVALAQVGKPYSTGGKGPDRFDCSGFVFYALNTSGYKLDYMTSSTWANADFTTIESIDDMQRGDIICLKGHVAIYLGDGVMVDASSKNGKIVVRGVGAWCKRNFRNAKRIWTIPEVADVTPRNTIELNIVN